MQNPRNGVIGNTTALSRTRQLSQRRLQSELKKFARTQSHGMTIDIVAAGGCTVAHAAGQIQKYSRVQRFSLFSAARTPETLQSLLLIRGETQRLPLRREWHKPFLHEMFAWYRYQQNEHLVVAKFGLVALQSPDLPEPCQHTRKR